MVIFPEGCVVETAQLGRAPSPARAREHGKKTPRSHPQTHPDHPALNTPAMFSAEPATQRFHSVYFPEQTKRELVVFPF